ncbi:MAG: glycosyltransferase family 2 protein [Planctomycetaceae bacterium]|nr:glycosyltransferase family 2 protein [Planctomycetaceae bacterium]
MKLLVVIVNYRTARLTIDCLQSLAAEGALPVGGRVVVTDNASGDDSVATIQAAIDAHGWGAWASLMPLPKNGGFAYGNNAAIRAARESDDPPEYVWLLNSDTLVHPGAVQTLITYLERHPTVGMVGSRLEDPDGTPQCSVFRFPSLLSELDEALRVGFVHRLLVNHVILRPIPTEACPADWVAGASLLVRREVFDAIGLLDEGYFLYYEEVDFCLRAARANWPCAYEPASRVVHLVGQSSGVTVRDQALPRRPRYWFDSRRRYFLLNHGRLFTAVLDAVWASAFLVGRTLLRLRRKPIFDPPQLWRDYVRHSVFVRGFGL